MKKFVSVLMALLFVLGISVCAMADELPKFSGLVTDATESSITVVNAYGNTLNFKVEDPDVMTAEIGSLVDVVYTGDIATLAIASDIIIVSPAVIKTVSGTVSAAESDKILVKPAKGSIVTVNLLAGTGVSGKANTYKEGDSVTVTYSECAQFMGTVNLGINIEVTKVQQEKKTEEEDTTNKKLTGVVTSFSHGGNITIRTSKGRKWTFKLYSKTSFPSKKELEEGCTVTITYDGYAANRPYAKKCNVTKTRIETERGKIYKKSGTVSDFGGMVISLTNGFWADVAYAKHSGGGEREPGRYVTVYYYKQGGENYATKIKWK